MFDPVPEIQFLALYAENGSNISRYDNKFLSLNFGLRRVFNHMFIITDVNNPIIGADFLGKFNLLVDMKHTKLVDNQTQLTMIGISTKLDERTPLNIFVTNKHSPLLMLFPALIQHL